MAVFHVIKKLSVPLLFHFWTSEQSGFQAFLANSLSVRARQLFSLSGFCPASMCPAFVGEHFGGFDLVSFERDRADFFLQPNAGRLLPFASGSGVADDVVFE